MYKELYKKQYICFFLFSTFIVFYGWIGDDALITIRTVLNFINGYGPVFNIGERVQGYTHPLWFFVLSGLIFITREIFYSTIFLSVSLSFCAVWILLKAHNLDKRPSMFMAFIVFLSFSSAFMDYTSSGLENPLGYFLFSVFIFCFYKSRYFFIPVIAAFLFLTRYDYFLIFTPFLIFYLFKSENDTGVWKEKFCSFSIFGFFVLLWFVFSLYYYGSLFPNTYYSKTFDYDRITKIIHSIDYYKATLSYDRFTLISVFICFVLALFRNQILSTRDRLVVFSVIPYFVYMFWIGGDFMMGRFFAIPLLITAPVFIKICFYFYDNPVFVIKRKSLKILLLLILFHPSFLINYGQLPVLKYVGRAIDAERTVLNFLFETNIKIFNPSAIVDEHFLFFEKPFLLPTKRVDLINRAFHQWSNQDLEKDFKLYTVGGLLGLAGLVGGKNSFIVDPIGLTDPYLSRFKTRMYYYDLRPGHGYRIPPLGYYSTLLTGGEFNHICDSDMKKRWNLVKEKTRGSLSLRKAFGYLVALFRENSPLPVPDFLNNLQLNKECHKLKSLYLQKIERKDISKRYNQDERCGGKYDFFDPRNSHLKKNGFFEVCLKDNLILDLSAQVLWGSVYNKQCFEITLDRYSQFSMEFYKEGSFFEKINTEDAPPQFFVKDRTEYFGKVYKICLKEALTTDDLVIKINCTPTVYRFCSIHSMEFL